MHLLNSFVAQGTRYAPTLRTQRVSSNAIHKLLLSRRRRAPQRYLQRLRQGTRQRELPKGHGPWLNEDASPAQDALEEERVGVSHAIYRPRLEKTAAKCFRVRLWVSMCVCVRVRACERARTNRRGLHGQGGS